MVGALRMGGLSVKRDRRVARTYVELLLHGTKYQLTDKSNESYWPVKIVFYFQFIIKLFKQENYMF